jgi:hypothetical protein
VLIHVQLQLLGPRVANLNRAQERTGCVEDLDVRLVAPIRQVPPDPMPELSSGPKPIEHLAERIEVLTMMCQRWPGVLEEVQRRVEEEQVRRQADFLRNHHADLAAAQSESSRRGEGRTSIVPEVPVSSVPLSEHLPGCVGPCCSPGLRQRGSLEALDGVENF